MRSKNLVCFFAITLFCNNLFAPWAQWAEQTLSQMTLDEKIGQLLMIAVPCNPDSATNADRLFTLQLPTDLNKDYATNMIRNYHVGGIIFICEGMVQEQVVATNYFQQQSKLPLFVAQDFEPGLVRLSDVVNYPRARIVAQAGDLDVTYRIGKQIGLQAKRLGVNVVLAPVVDVQTNDKNPVINTRSFGKTPQLVAEHGQALMRGIQEAGVIACAKHFPGHGDTSVDSHLGLPRLEHGIDRLNAIELVPFKKLIDAGVAAVMPGHLLVPHIDAENPTSLSSIFIKELLQKKLGFKGLIFTDALIMKALTLHTQEGTAALKSLLAGCTMAVFPDDVPKSFAIIKAAVEQGAFSEQELNEKVLLILQTKQQLGLHQNRLVSEQNVANDICTQQALALQQEVLERTRSV